MNRPRPHSAAVQLAGAAGFFLLSMAAAHADIYRCVDAGGDVVYGDAPCSGDGVMSANITEAVGACTNAECQAQLESARASAEERLRAERAALSEMEDLRLRAEALDLQRRLQMQQDQLHKLEAQLAADSGVYYPAYPLYPGAGYPGYDRLGYGDPGYRKPGMPCRGSACAARPDWSGAGHRGAFREPAVNLIVPGPFKAPKYPK